MTVCRGKSTKQHLWKTYHTESIYTPHWVTRYCPANDNMTSICDLQLVTTKHQPSINQASTKQHLRNTLYFILWLTLCQPSNILERLIIQSQSIHLFESQEIIQPMTNGFILWLTLSVNVSLQIDCERTTLKVPHKIFLILTLRNTSLAFSRFRVCSNAAIIFRSIQFITNKSSSIN